MPAPLRTPTSASVPAPPHCEVSELFAMLGKPHMLEILAAFRDARGQPIRFSTLQGQLGISPKTLAVRLRVLVGAGLLERRSYRETPPRVEYRSTAKSAELDELFAVLRNWAGRHTLTPAVVAPPAGPRGPRPSAPSAS